MVYVPEVWVDDDGTATTGTAMTAARMNHIEEGVEAAHDLIASGSVADRAATTVNVPSQGNNATWAGNVALGLSFHVMRVATDFAARVRLYATPAYRDADLARPIGTAPSGDHGLIAEVVTSAALLSLALSPQATGSDLKAAPDGNVAISVTNLSGATRPLVVAITAQPIE